MATIISTTSINLILLCGDVESNPGPITTHFGIQSSNADIDFRIALQESYYQSLVSHPNLAHQVVENARRIGLNNLTFDRPTPGDGNCFYHAILQQLQRPEIMQQLPTHLHFNNHDALRVAVVNFVKENSPMSNISKLPASLQSNIYPNLTFEQNFKSTTTKFHICP